MDAIRERFHYLFRSTKGLVLLAIGAVALVAAIWGTLSGPMVEWGVRDITVKMLGMKLQAAEREVYPLAIRAFAEGRVTVDGGRARVAQG